MNQLRIFNDTKKTKGIHFQGVMNNRYLDESNGKYVVLVGRLIDKISHQEDKDFYRNYRFSLENKPPSESLSEIDQTLKNKINPKKLEKQYRRHRKKSQKTDSNKSYDLEIEQTVDKTNMEYEIPVQKNEEVTEVTPIKLDESVYEQQNLKSYITNSDSEEENDPSCTKVYKTKKLT
jgi:hypothetical protein